MKGRPHSAARHHQRLARHVAVEHYRLDAVMAEGVGERGRHGAGMIGGQGLVIGRLGDVLGAVARMLDHGQRVAGGEEDGSCAGSRRLATASSRATWPRPMPLVG